MLDFRPHEVIVEVGSEESPILRNLRRSLPGIPITLVDHPQRFLSAIRASKDPLGKGKRHLLLMRHKGDFLKKCPGSEGQVSEFVEDKDKDGRAGSAPRGRLPVAPPGGSPQA